MGIPPLDSAEVSVIVPCGGRLTHLDQLAAALARQQATFAWEAVFVDNGLTSGERQKLEHVVARLRRARIVDEPLAVGIGPARNAGARAAEGSILAFVDADDVPGDQWLAGLIDGVNTGMISAGRLDTDELNPTWLAHTRGDHDPEGVYACEGLFPVAPGGNFAITKADFDGLGGFAPSAISLEDFELSLRAWEAGLVVHRAGPTSIVHYRLRPDAGALARQGFLYGEARARTYASLWRRGLVPRWRLRGWKSWLLLVLIAPLVPFSRRRRGEAAWIAGNRIGRVVGSWRHRVVYL